MSNTDGNEREQALLYGHAVGDALGVPVEFTSRQERQAQPVTDMIGYGSYAVPAGSWSDDTSMTLCLLESLKRQKKVDYDDIMQNFVRWLDDAAFTATGETFDVGRGCLHAIRKYEEGTPATECGGKASLDNGNGSLMRISPMVLYFAKQGKQTLALADLAVIHQVSSLTHGHIRSHVACDIYVAIGLYLYAGKTLPEAIAAGIEEITALYQTLPAYHDELVTTYQRIINIAVFSTLPENTIHSSGYVLDTLEAVLWCLLTTKNYTECVLKAVNLGEDTDTIAAIAGGLAGLAYGLQNIPKAWLNQLQNHELLEKLMS